jgi:hypothetical protein
MNWVLIGLIIGIVAGLLTSIAILLGAGRKTVSWLRERKSRRLERQRQAERARRAAARRPVRRRKRLRDGGWVFRGTGTSPRRWMDGWRGDKDWDE